MEKKRFLLLLFFIYLFIFKSSEKKGLKEKRRGRK